LAIHVYGSSDLLTADEHQLRLPPWISIRAGHLHPERPQSKRIMQAVGWAKTVGGMSQSIYCGVERFQPRFILTKVTNSRTQLVFSSILEKRSHHQAVG
jgi:hypothetical protein